MNNKDKELRETKQVEDYKAKVNWPENSKSPYIVNIQPLEAFDSPNPKGTESVSLQPGLKEILETEGNVYEYQPLTVDSFRQAVGLPPETKLTKAKKLMISLIVGLIFIVTAKIIQFRQFLKRRNESNLDNS